MSWGGGSCHKVGGMSLQADSSPVTRRNHGNPGTTLHPSACGTELLISGKEAHTYLNMTADISQAGGWDLWGPVIHNLQ